MAKQLVVFLHGVGSRGADLIDLGQHWAKQLPQTCFVAPNAPNPSDFGSGFQWFSLADITEQSRPERIAAARASFDEMLQQVIDENQLDLHRDKLVLVGFSQGAIMALDVLVSARFPVAGIVAFSGRLASPKPWNPDANSQVLLVHGTHDPVIPWQSSVAAAAELDKLGLHPETLYENGMTHTISATGASVAAEFIQRCFS